MSITAISPIDGRYASKTSSLIPYFSEFALIKYRVRVEIEYFLALTKQPIGALADFPKESENEIRKIYRDFSEAHAEKVKGFEAVTNHDVKAVEYFIKESFEDLGLQRYNEFIHFGLTSQDINNTSVPVSIKECFDEVWFPLFEEVCDTLSKMSIEWKNVPMLARTHGQPASPTRLGKEIQVFAERLKTQAEGLKNIPVCGKFGGATGNFNAHFVAFPEIDWVDFSNQFLKNNLGIERLQTTTQIEHYDQLAARFDAFKRINTILMDLCRDIWHYVSLDYFKQSIKKGEVGSSAMPHKVNPIDFENAEGNLGLANAVLEHLSAKLPISRLQRDLTDSTVLRNIGMPFGYSLVALQSLKKGLGKLLLNEETFLADLDKNWSVAAEAIQTILRREGYEKPYEALRDLTRTNETINRESLHAFIDRLKVSEKVKSELKEITPFNYLGIQLVQE
ncbi:MAG TPA: adenylosuccinate lyase [Cryomorphaceae bacterium]|nr:adenylosuccinate lyase [Cryomorphaceae bacterium]